MINSFEESHALREAGDTRRRRFTEEFKYACVIEWMQLKSATAVARIAGVNKSVIIRWVTLPWWDEMVKAIEKDRANSPRAKALAERLDNVIEKMVDKLEEEDAITGLATREIGYNLHKILVARNIERGDPAATSKVLSNLEPDELVKLINQILKEIASTMGGKFGEATEAGDLSIVEIMGMMEAAKEGKASE